MSEKTKEMDSAGREMVDKITETMPVWTNTKYRERIMKSLAELDEAWELKLSTPFFEIIKELKRLIFLVFCKEFVTAKMAIKFQVNNNEFWLVPGPKAAKYLKTSLPTISGTEIIELLIDQPPDGKTLTFIFSVKKNFPAKVEAKLL